MMSSASLTESALGAYRRGDRLLGEVAAADEPFVVLFDQQRAGEADQRGVVGEDADDVGAAADLAVDALERVGRAQLASSARAGSRRNASRSSSASSSSCATFGRALEPLDDVGERSRGLLAGSAAKIWRIAAATICCWALRDVAEHVAQEVHGAALPGAAEHLADRLLQALRGRRRRTSCTPSGRARRRARRKLAPEGLGLGLADVEADHLAPAGLVHARRRSPGTSDARRRGSRTRSILASSHR